MIATYTNNDAKKMIEEHKVVMAGGSYSDEDAEAQKDLMRSNTQRRAKQKGIIRLARY